jgi:hypothetical protein
LFYDVCAGLQSFSYVGLRRRFANISQLEEMTLFVLVDVREEEDGTFWDTFGHLPTQPAAYPNPKLRKQTKTSLFKNFGASLLLLLHTFQKIKLESVSILPNV